MGAALGALPRFAPPRALRQGLGLLPAASASGARRPQGARTPAGTTPARRARVAGAWASRSRAQVRRHGPRRRAPPPSFSRLAAGQPKAGGAHAPAPWGPAAHRPTSSPWLWPGPARAACGPGPTSGRSPPQPRRLVDRWPRHGARFPRAAAEAPPRGGVILGSMQRLRKETRAESAAGPRRRHGRGEPPHGSPQEHPSSLTGSASSEAPRTHRGGCPAKSGDQLLTLDVRATLALTCRWKPERRRSGGWRQSGAVPDCVKTPFLEHTGFARC